MSDLPPDLDHLVLATPDLAVAVARFETLTGTRPARGGSHTGFGTANFLVGLGGGAYLEIVGPDTSQPDPSGPRPFGVDDLDRIRLVTWAVHPTDVEAVIARARSAGDDPGELTPMSRRTPDGSELRWRLTPARGVVPFLLDWGDTAHPTSRPMPSVELVSFTLGHPDAAAVRRQLAALGVRASVEPAVQPTIAAVLSTPRGSVSTADLAAGGGMSA